MSKSFRVRMHIAAPPGTVWAAITDRAALEAWFAEHAAVALDEGRYEFWGRDVPGGEPGRQRLLDVEPERRLRFAWDLGDRETEVELTLEPQEGETLVTVTQSDSPDWGLRAGARDFLARATRALAEYAEGRPPVQRHDFTRAPSEPRVAIDIDAPPAQVFASLVEPEQLDRWIATRAVVEPRVGGRLDFGWDHGPMKILELHPDRTLAYSWSYPGEPDTVVRWELEGSAGRTHLTVVHSGFAERADGYEIGWLGFLVELKRMHELGERWHKLEWEAVEVAA